MIDNIRQIKEVALELRDGTSRNDDRRVKMQKLCDLADELRDHFVDDMR